MVLEGSFASYLVMAWYDSTTVIYTMRLQIPVSPHLHLKLPLLDLYSAKQT